MKEITIGAASDGIAVTIDGRRFWINQEDDQGEAWTEVFEHLGFIVNVEEEY